MSLKIGVASKLYRNSNTYASPTWNEVPIVQDVELPHSAEQGDATCRISDYKLSEPTLKDLSFEFNLLWVEGHEDFEAIRDAWLNKTVLDVAALDGPSGTAGSQGPRAEVKVFEFSESQPLNGVNVAKVVLRPCFPVSSTGPTWMEVE